MKKIISNKKGFTLVELLAVIVILALIMSIAIISMSTIMQGAKYSTFKETGLQIINGVRQQLTLANELDIDNARLTTGVGVDFYIPSSLLEKGGTKSPFNGTISYYSEAPANSVAVGTSGIYRYDGTAQNTNLTCQSVANNYSFVRVKYDTTAKNFVYAICLTAGANNYRIDVTNGTEANLLNTNDNSMVINTNS